jgi:hypothetical protein
MHETIMRNHAFYVHSTCILRAFYVHSTCILRAFYVHAMARLTGAIDCQLRVHAFTGTAPHGPTDTGCSRTAAATALRYMQPSTGDRHGLSKQYGNDGNLHCKTAQSAGTMYSHTVMQAGEKAGSQAAG